ncbi:MAG: hypothetical protein WCP21_08905 [Armatimonadota bacterium]
MPRRWQDPRGEKPIDRNDTARCEVGAAVEQYLADCERRNLAEGTTAWYRRRLTKRLERWWHEDVGILQGEMLEQGRKAGDGVGG